ncbi:MAG: VOC family protein [Bacteroidetes bacterium]|nr:VOC family protein [Bacteroidota bacterium]
MPLLIFNISRKSKGRVAQHDFDVVEYVHPQLTFGINSPRKAYKNDAVHRQKPGSLHHLAFKAASCEEVDALYEQLKAIGAEIVEAPRYFPQHGEKYYSLFFKDPGVIKFEIVFEER